MERHFRLGSALRGMERVDEATLSYTLRERKEFAISRESTAPEMSANRPGECNEKKRAKEMGRKRRKNHFIDAF